LGKTAAPDLSFLSEIMGLIDEGTDTRLSLVSELSTRYPDWSAPEVQTNLAGYVGRAREWGLLERKQTKGRYVATAQGPRLVREAMKTLAKQGGV
jgi:hypothetical protein